MSLKSRRGSHNLKFGGQTVQTRGQQQQTPCLKTGQAYYVS